MFLSNKYSEKPRKKATTPPIPIFIISKKLSVTSVVANNCSVVKNDKPNEEEIKC